MNTSCRGFLVGGLLAGMVAIAGCGSGSDLQSADDAREQARAELLAEQKVQDAERRQEELEDKIKELEDRQKDADDARERAERVKKKAAEEERNSAPAAPRSLPGTSCGDGISVGPNTSCAFARNVYLDWHNSGGGTRTVVTYSPVTNTDYTMNCSSSGVMTTCRGGNNAVVYIR